MAEERDARPSLIRNGKKGGILRFDFAETEETFEQIDWDAFFGIFDREKLAFLRQERTDDGKLSRFNKFVRRDT